MKFKLPHYREKVDSPKQSFTPYVDDYRLNEQNNSLVKTGTVTNKQEQIQSALESTFDKILQKLMPGEVVSPEKVATRTLTHIQDRLDLMSEAYNTAEEFRKKYNLSDDMPVADIFAYVQNKALELTNTINDSNKNKKVTELENQIADLQNKLKEVKD